MLGVFAALAANFISPRGLSLTRNYFPVKGGNGPVADVADVTVISVGDLPTAAQNKPLTVPRPAEASKDAEITIVTTAQVLARR